MLSRFIRCSPLLLPVLLVLVLEAGASAELRLASIFADHAVLQRNQPLEIWGWAEPGEQVTVELGKSQSSAAADKLGRWSVTLAAQPMSLEPMTLRVVGASTIEHTDILLGDVWLCSGQSNMEFPLGACDAQADIDQANFPAIRHFGVEYHFASRPVDDVRGQWQVCTPQSAVGFSAVGFYFARRIHQETGVPIGLMRSCVGGTNIECWMSQETLLSTPELEPFAKRMRESLAEYQVELKEALPGIEAWADASRRAIDEGREVPLPPIWPEFPFGERRFRPRCVTLHNGMIHPLIPMGLKGVVWYQGENNAGSAEDGEQYIAKKRAMIQDWRRWFRNAQLPFYFVQLAAWQAPNAEPAGGDGWADFRDAQRRCLTIPHTGMASAVDLGDADDIHPKNKFDVGERLACHALVNEYGKVGIEVSGPLYKSSRVDGSAMRIEFDHVGDGLAVGRKLGREPTEIVANGKLAGFAIAGADKRWRWADARIDGASVVCSHPDVTNPVAVRYAYSMNPHSANLINRQGLPASPFRTDHW